LSVSREVPRPARNKLLANVSDHCQIFPIIARHMASTVKGKMDDQKRSFQERLSAFAEEERKKALALPPGPERDLALRKIRQARTAANLDGWANSPGLKPPI
jgi:hypothetical protein